MPKNNDFRNNLINEVRFFIQSGKSRDEILEVLTKNGVSPRFINELIDYVQSQNGINEESFQSTQQPQQQNVMKVEHTHKLSLGTFAFILLFLVILMASGYFLLFNQEEGGEYLLDYEVELTKDSFYISQYLEFNTKYTNMGSERSYDVFTKYKVINAKQETMMEWEDTKAVSNVQKYYVTQRIPENIPKGKYYVYSEVNYGDSQKATARSLYFDIMEKESTPQPEPVENTTEETMPEENQTEESIPEENETIIAEENETSEEEIVEINQTEEEGEEQVNETDDGLTEIELQQIKQQEALDAIDMAKSYSKTDPQKAANICKNLSETKLTDNCFQQLAKSSKNYNFCTSIRDTPASDFCYLSYVIDVGDYEKCSSIVSEKTKKSCYQLNPEYTG